MSDTCTTYACGPAQIVTISIPINDITAVRIYKSGGYDDGCFYTEPELSLSHSTDSVCWSCWTDYATELAATAGMQSDFYIRYKINGPVSGVYTKTEGNWETINTWSASLAQGFEFAACADSNPNLYNPYANMDCAIKLQQQLAETAACMFGIPVYYFKVSGAADSADLTFKEYALKSVISVKQIKIVIKDGQMPSSKPEFADIGLSWQTDWEVEVPKGMFATAFGQSEQPTEGDLVYIPMMRRMWQVSEAYDEKNGSLMWVSTTFRLALVKYQDEMMVDKETGGFDDMISSLVKNKYEDLFGDQETLGSGAEAAEPIKAEPDNMTPVYESDACRKYVSVSGTYINNANTGSGSQRDTSLYYKGTLIADSFYEFTGAPGTASVEYQRKWCGSELSFSFLVNITGGEGTLFSIGDIKIAYEPNSNGNAYSIYIKQNTDLRVNVTAGAWHLVVFRFSKKLNTADLSSYTYTYPSSIHEYKLRKFHYYFDIDNGDTATAVWDSELESAEKQPVIMHGIAGSITNVKCADTYIDDTTELMQQHPSSQHMLINDTARPLFGLNGVKMF